MKKLFGNKVNSNDEWDGYDDVDFDWDETGQYETEYETKQYETDGSEAHAEDAYVEENSEYYEVGAEYYAEENGECCAEEDYVEDNGEYYAEEDYVEDNGEYYADDEADLEESGEYYAESEDAYFEEDDASWFEEEQPVAVAPTKKSGKTNRRKKGFFAVLWANFLDMALMDRIITVTGIAVLLMALVTGGVYLAGKSAGDSVSELANVGSQLEGITLIGEKGLMAVADAEMARRAAAEMLEEEEEQKEYNESEYENKVDVKLSMTSVMKDLKIKFTNKETGKLIANVPFSVTITKPDGKSETWEDDDMDGIIYKKGIASGTYKVLVNELTNERYENYTIPAGVQTVDVKKNISYEKIDVSDEVKTEAEIDVAKEDTKKNETVVESTLENTVNWVESTTVTETYTEVSKSMIPDPTTFAMRQSVMRTAAASGAVTGGDAITVTNPPVITLDKTTEKVYLNDSITLNAKVVDATTNAAIVAESSDTGVATATVNGGVVTVTGVGVGEATITAKYAENNQETKATCVVRVMTHPKDNKADKLKDLNGNQLYVMENDTYREAVYADYYTADKFFVKGDVKYTGWQTINGSVYYFTASGEKVTGEQIIQGAKYNFASDGSLITGSGTLGIDVSKWNGKIDWNAVKNSGISYVIIRCGYRGSSQGMLVEDPKFDTNVKGALNAGLKVGVYFFTQATDEIEAVEEASFVLDQIKNYKISYPVFLDVEPSGGRGDKIDKTTRTAVCKAFCETIQRAGYTAGIYANKTWLNEKLDTGSLGAYKIWLAQYAATPTYTGRYDMWQYTSKGKVSGISGDVDLNMSYLGY